MLSTEVEEVKRQRFATKLSSSDFLENRNETLQPTPGLMARGAVWERLTRIDGLFRRARRYENSLAWFAGFFLLRPHALYYCTGPPFLFSG